MTGQRSGPGIELTEFSEDRSESLGVEDVGLSRGCVGRRE